jgi:hypothetical protein
MNPVGESRFTERPFAVRHCSIRDSNEADPRRRRTKLQRDRAAGGAGAHDANADRVARRLTFLKRCIYEHSFTFLLVDCKSICHI